MITSNGAKVLYPYQIPTVYAMTMCVSYELVAATGRKSVYAISDLLRAHSAAEAIIRREHGDHCTMQA